MTGQGQGTADAFLARLDISGLLPTGIPPWCMAPTAEGTAAALVRERLLTPFQARQLLRGKTAGFFPSDRYKVVDLLGEGGMGQVLLCEHLYLKKLVAVKQLAPAERGNGGEERFRCEARAAARLDDTNIVRVHDVDETGATPLLAMEYIEGTDLHTLVARHGPLSVGRVAGYVRQAALGLAHAHAAGVVHRDVKPGNLMVDRDGTVKVIDFGLSWIAGEEDVWDDEFLLGTADFAAPEQAEHGATVDARSDIYSLGCSAYFLLTGNFPFEGGTVADKVRHHRTEEPPPLLALRPELPDGVLGIVERMRRKRPADRIQTALEVASALGDYCNELLAPADEELPPPRRASYRLGVTPPRGQNGRPLPSRRTPAPMAALMVDSKIFERMTAEKHEPPSVEPPPTTPLTRDVVRPGLTAAAAYAGCAGFGLGVLTRFGWF